MSRRTTSRASSSGPRSLALSTRPRPRPFLSRPPNLLPRAERQNGYPARATERPSRAGPGRFHGSVVLDAQRVGRDAGRIADEVIAHLAGLVGSTVKVTLEIEAEIEAGASEQVVRTVTENSRTLKFTTHGFEQE
jgi:hypothetical protein